MGNNENLDSKNAMIAVVLSALVLFGWNYLFPSPVFEPVPQEKQAEATESDPILEDNATQPPVERKLTEKTDVQLITLKNEKAEVVIDSSLNLQEFKFSNTSKSMKDIIPKFKHATSLVINGSAINEPFKWEKLADDHFKISNSVAAGSVQLNNKGQLDIKLDADSPFQLISRLYAKEESIGAKIKNFAYYTDEVNTVAFGDDPFEEKEVKSEWYGVDFNYHILAFSVPKNLYHIKGEGEEVSLVNRKKVASFNYQISFLKKDYEDLKGLGSNLGNALDFGIWAVISLPMLQFMQMMYGFLQNWGLAIIVLTIIIRTIMFPLQYSSFKSMKKMQVLQPELKSIREKYKEDPQRMQQETMALFKKHGANPMGGCLPLFLQMPIFFAFYRMLDNSVELVEAPFYLWINDLSQKDPYYVLPVLMGVAMFFNMKLTPSSATMDPAQQKLMKFMPVIFAAFLISMPAGLNLYILVSTLLGMLQQVYVYRRTSA